MWKLVAVEFVIVTIILGGYTVVFKLVEVKYMFMLGYATVTMIICAMLVIFAMVVFTFVMLVVVKIKPVLLVLNIVIVIFGVA